MKKVKNKFWDSIGKAVEDVVGNGIKKTAPIVGKVEILVTKSKDDVKEIVEKGKNKVFIKKKDDQGIKDKEVKERLEYSIKITKLVEDIKKLKLKIKDNNEFEDTLVALFAVAFSVANCDGEIHPDELEDVKLFISGESFNNYPESLKNKINALKNNPPNFNTAMEYVKRIKKERLGIIDDIIDIAMEADGIVRKEEQAYKEAWRKFKEESN